MPIIFQNPLGLGQKLFWKDRAVRVLIFDKVARLFWSKKKKERQQIFFKVGNGGFSLRKVASHYEIAKDQQNFISDVLKAKENIQETFGFEIAEANEVKNNSILIDLEKYNLIAESGIEAALKAQNSTQLI